MIHDHDALQPGEKTKGNDDDHDAQRVTMNFLTPKAGTTEPK
jgi:hypothetical protein